jgi:hypothetical protein
MDSKIHGHIRTWEIGNLEFRDEEARCEELHGSDLED